MDRPAIPIRFLVAGAAAAGLRLWLDDGRLELRGPKTEQAAAFARQLREREPEVVDYLPGACTACRGPLWWNWPAHDRRCVSCRLAAGEDATPPGVSTCRTCGSPLIAEESIARGTCLVCHLEATGRRHIVTETALRREADAWLRGEDAA